MEYRVGSGGIASYVCFLFLWVAGIFGGIYWILLSAGHGHHGHALSVPTPQFLKERNETKQNSWSARKALDCTFWVSLFLMSMRDRSSVRVAVYFYFYDAGRDGMDGWLYDL